MNPDDAKDVIKIVESHQSIMHGLSTVESKLEPLGDELVGSAYQSRL